MSVLSGSVSIHAPVRVRPIIRRKIKNNIHVSIHAPVRVRRGDKMTEQFLLCFNSRTREGATKKVVFSGEDLESFNSRTREGATDPYTII